MSTISSPEISVRVCVHSLELPRIRLKAEPPVFVVFTSIQRTLKALEKAQEIAQPLGASVVVLAVQVVPYPLPLDQPPVSFEFVVKRFEDEAGDFPENTEISAYLCRDPIEALRRILNPKSPIVMGIRKHGWLNRDETRARKLRRAGYDVIVVHEE